MFSLWISSTLYKLKQQNCWYNLFKKKLNMFRVVKMFIFLCICIWCICECEHAHSVEHVCRSDGSFFPHCLQWTDDRCLELIFSLPFASCFSVCFRLAGQQTWGDSPLSTSHLPIVILGLQMGSTTFGFFMCVLEILGSLDLPST